MADSPTLKRNKMGTVMEASPDDLVKLLLGSKADPADTPMGSSKRSPKELAQLISNDAALVEGRAKFEPKDGGRERAAAASRLKQDSDKGQYAVPGQGDLGQFLKKGGKVNAKYMSFSKAGKPAGMKSVTKMASGGSASSRGDGIAQRGKTKGRMC
jgi:hypothetical protein